MSRFVSGGTVDEPIERDEAWLKAQQEIEANRKEKEELGRQESGKSLFETLQANKAAKQEAFEESIRLKNQFRSLDEDEVEFLDSVLESTRAKESAVKKETAEQLELFRRQREETEKAARITESDGQPANGETWAVRKRKRGREKETLSGFKLRKASSTKSNPEEAEERKTETPLLPTPKENPLDPTSTPKTSHGKPESISPPIIETAVAEIMKSPVPAASKAPAVALGLGDYSSDDE